MLYIDNAVHGCIEIPAEIAAIIETAPFQRLRKVRQLGFLPTVISISGATRYEHCIGTYYLAKKMLIRLVENTSWLANEGGLPRVYKKAVEIAALLHDVGHGPFSHTWEEIGENYHHEENALPCIDEIFATIPSEFLPELRENDNFGIQLIKALILGDMNRVSAVVPKKYGFIFEIVNNKKCKLDVDKWDYLARDRYYLQKWCQPNIDFGDLFLEARVSDDGAHVEYRYKDYDKIYALFVARWMLHTKCYRVPKALLYDGLLQRIVARCDERINGKRLHEINAYDMPAFLQLTDDRVLQAIKDDEEFKYFLDVSKIKEADESIMQEKNQPHKVAIVKQKVPAPGVEMPSDENFSFYGEDEREKPRIVRNMKSTENIGYFVYT